MGERKILKSLQAVRLLLKGRNAWNKWANENPACDIDFSFFDYNQNRDLFRGMKNSDKFDFSNLIFPKSGSITFESVNFGPHINLNFDKSIFGNGNIIFKKTNFGNKASFLETKFGYGNVDFSNTHFGGKNVSFNKSIFLGDVCFKESVFNSTETEFKNVRFLGKKVNFSQAKFECERVTFDDSVFNDGKIIFIQTEFKYCAMYFDKISFGINEISFYSAKFDKCECFFGIQRRTQNYQKAWYQLHLRILIS